MVQSPSWEANWFAASQEILRISRNPKIHYRTHKLPNNIYYVWRGTKYRGADKSLARPGRKQANISVRKAWISFRALPCKKKIWWQLASPCWWNRVRPWRASELISFLVGLRTYQHPGKHRYQNVCRKSTKIDISRSLLKSSTFERRKYRSPYWRAIMHQVFHVLFMLRCTAVINMKGRSADRIWQLAGREVGSMWRGVRFFGATANPTHTTRQTRDS